MEKLDICIKEIFDYLIILVTNCKVFFLSKFDFNYSSLIFLFHGFIHLIINLLS